MILMPGGWTLVKVKDVPKEAFQFLVADPLEARQPGHTWTASMSMDEQRMRVHLGELHLTALRIDDLLRRARALYEAQR